MQLRSTRARRALPSSILQRGAVPIFGLGLALVLIAQSLVSCGSDDAKCTIGEEKPCANPSCEDSLGAQVCQDDGTYSTCSCGTPGAGGSSMAGAAGSSMGGAGGTTGTTAQALVGLPCAADADCQADLTCVLPTANGPFQNGGPQGGYCTKSCTVTEDCESIDRFADCLRVDNGGTPNDTSDDTRVCVELCLSDTPDANEAKCHLVTQIRSNLACLAQTLPPAGETRSLGFCVPFCHSDAGCGNGRFCDLSTGVCVDQAPTGAAIGALCAADTDCASGFCAQFNDGTSFCSGFCTYGSIGGCGFEATGVAPGTREAACLDPFPFTQGVPVGVGDVGACTELCDTAEDCAQAGWTCEPLASRGFPQNAIDGWGRFGFCNPPGATPAPADAG